MQIGELARQTGCEVETIRYYEREGLLPAPARSASGYRRYEPQHVEQLNFIRHCRSLGMSLADIRQLADYHRHPAPEPCDRVNTLIDDQIRRVHSQIEALQQLERQLLALRGRCASPHTLADCGILKMLEDASSGEPCVCHPPATDKKIAG